MGCYSKTIKFAHGELGHKETLCLHLDPTWRAHLRIQTVATLEDGVRRRFNEHQAFQRIEDIHLSRRYRFRNGGDLFYSVIVCWGG
jgi:hypothetical protein